MADTNDWHCQSECVAQPFGFAVAFNQSQRITKRQSERVAFRLSQPVTLGVPVTFSIAIHIRRVIDA
jgi:hypothetical protein